MAKLDGDRGARDPPFGAVAAPSATAS